MVLRVEQPGIELHRLLELPDGLRRLPLLPEHEAEAIVRLGHARRGADRGGVRTGRGGELLPALVNHA